ncbi:hypothetical protein JTE90_022180 [Oedothorax gibbosus]|uniref:Integrase catalytic domain-containing protein n=1 Tax=Oedothorax gibbosus TaxID=931172 RepID=A0AAV6VP26_9ARAC|nr:hypothetical protein JTE90_022180 [Oedothorax gibbosus]
MSPYTFMAEVNGFFMPILRDTGTSIDVMCRNRITPEMLTGENIWVQQPLDEFPVCLPLAEVELKGEFGHVITKAAVVPCQLDKGSALSTTFLEKFGIKVVHSSVYHPQSNPIERFHRTVKRVLKVLCLESGSDWEQAIYPALFALRTVTHESTGFTPAELVHGKNLRTPLTLLYEKWLDVEETEGEPVTEYVFSLINRMKRCQELAISKMEECQQKNKTWYDKRAVKREFRIGDLVLIFATFKSNKLSPHWTGPGKILRKLSETNYVVQ